MKVVDTHAHLNFSAYDKDMPLVIDRTMGKEVGVINVGSQYSTSQKAVEIAETQKSGFYAAVGLHPLHLKKQVIHYQDDDELTQEEIKTREESFDIKKYKELAKNPKVVAIGEMGLDYHHFEESDNVEELKKKQKAVFAKAIKLANDVKKPIIIHCWDAYDDLLEMLLSDPVKKKGVIHSFVGGFKAANKFIELGYKIGLNGIITYSESYDRLIKEISLEDIVLETDCPYLSPIPHKGERNEPMFVLEVANKLASVKGLPVDTVLKQTTENAEKLFDLI